MYPHLNPGTGLANLSNEALNIWCTQTEDQRAFHLRLIKGLDQKFSPRPKLEYIFTSQVDHQK